MGIKASVKNFLSGERVDAHSTPPCLLELRSSKLFIIFTITVAVFTDIFLYGIIVRTKPQLKDLAIKNFQVPVIPFALSNRAGVAEDSVQKWVSVLLAVYGGALLVGSPIAGFLADQSASRRLPLLFGLLAIGGATVMLCLARVVWLIVLGRILQGAAAAVVWTVGTALLVDTVGEEKIGETLGWVSSSMGIGFFLAPLLGGIVYEKVGYFSVYYMAFALIVVDIILRLALIEKKIALQWAVHETPTLERPVSGSRTTDLTDEEKISGCDQNAVTCLQPTVGRNSLNGNDVSNENHSSEDKKSKWPPIVTLLTSGRLLTALWGCVVQGSLMTAFDSVLPLFVQRVFGVSVHLSLTPRSTITFRLSEPFKPQFFIFQASSTAHIFLYHIEVSLC
jgi:MFS family permease